MLTGTKYADGSETSADYDAYGRVIKSYITDVNKKRYPIDATVYDNKRKVNEPKNVKRKAKKLSPEAKKGYENALNGLANGDTRGLNDHSLGENRSGQRSVDIKGTGSGRGAGRIVYEYGEDGEINIIEILTDHNY